MKAKTVLKLCIDLSMTILLLCQMAYRLIGETAHEWTGSGMFVLFILHHVLNRQWYIHLTKGRYPLTRIFQVFVNFVILLCMLSLMLSGILLSREVFSRLPINSGTAFARSLHMPAAHWGFIFMSLHLGQHGNMVLGVIRRLGANSKSTAESVKRTRILRALALLICAGGILAFIKNDIAGYIFGKNQFAFYDMEQPLAQFFAEYIAMMGLWACLGHYTSHAIQKTEQRLRSS